jgi:hypothetical protein
MVAEMSKDNNIEIEINSETSRIRSILVNSGMYNFADAEKKLAVSALSLMIGNDAANTPAGQAAFLTAAATGARCFGHVVISGTLDTLLLLPLPIPAKTLAEAAVYFGAQRNDAPASARKILFGSSLITSNGWAVRATWDGWVSGVAPVNYPVFPGRSDCMLAGVAAGALTVGQAFLAEQGDVRAGKTEQSFSLWLPDHFGKDGVLDPGPDLAAVYLPASLWFVGLGNLGQAFLWSLSLLPYPKPEEVLLLFQDDQCVGKENWGTSILVKRGYYGALKTRIAEDWAMQRGFHVRRIDRRLDANLFRNPTEPNIALAGLDRMPARRLLGGPGFDYIIDAGLGATVADYRKFRLNVFDSSANPSNHFADVEDETAQVIQNLMQLPAYKQLAESRGDGGCGAATLAGSSVAVPFVSAVVGALSITQAIRIASGKAHHIGITGDTGNIRSIRGVLGEAPERVVVSSIRPAA